MNFVPIEIIKEIALYSKRNEYKLLGLLNKNIYKALFKDKYFLELWCKHKFFEEIGINGNEDLINYTDFYIDFMYDLNDMIKINKYIDLKYLYVRDFYFYDVELKKVIIRPSLLQMEPNADFYGDIYYIKDNILHIFNEWRYDNRNQWPGLYLGEEEKSYFSEAQLPTAFKISYTNKTFIIYKNQNTEYIFDMKSRKFLLPPDISEYEEKEIFDNLNLPIPIENTMLKPRDNDIYQYENYRRLSRKYVKANLSDNPNFSPGRKIKKKYFKSVNRMLILKLEPDIDEYAYRDYADEILEYNNFDENLFAEESMIKPYTKDIYDKHIIKKEQIKNKKKKKDNRKK